MSACRSLAAVSDLADDCGASALFVRSELARTEPVEPVAPEPPVQWASLSSGTRSPARTVARLATWAPGSDDDSGLIALPAELARPHARDRARRRPVARLALAVPRSSESGLVELGPWPGGAAANGPHAPREIAPMRDVVQAVGGAGPMPQNVGALGLDRVGFSLLVISCAVLTVVATLVTRVAIG